MSSLPRAPPSPDVAKTRTPHRSRVLVYIDRLNIGTDVRKGVGCGWSGGRRDESRRGRAA
eukprot:480228-Pleurochrysis_carterae.AAC.2